jgi:hypothetical protein
MGLAFSRWRRAARSDGRLAGIVVRACSRVRRLQRCLLHGLTWRRRAESRPGFNAYYFIDISALAWWYILIGLILVLAGLAAMQMKAWGRWVGVIAVGVAMISEFMWLPIYPIWSILLITLYFFMIIGLVIARPSE